MITDVFPTADLNYLDSGMRRTLIPGERSFEADSGFRVIEEFRPRLLQYEIGLSGRTTTQIETLRAFYELVRGTREIFTFPDPHLNRDVTCRFESGLPEELEIDEFTNTTVVIKEQVGAAMRNYPTRPITIRAAKDAAWVGSWTEQTSASYKSGTAMRSSAANETLTFVYAGYGCTVFAQGASTIDVYINGVKQNGSPISLAAGDIDTPVFTKSDLGAKLYYVRIVNLQALQLNVDCLRHVRTGRDDGESETL